MAFLTTKTVQNILQTILNSKILFKMHFLSLCNDKNGILNDKMAFKMHFQTHYVSFAQIEDYYISDFSVK